MKAQVENWSLVVLGAWNTAILTPDWLSKQLRIDGPVQIEFPVGNPFLPIRYTMQGIRLVVQPEGLSLAPSADDEAVLTRMEGFAKTILEILTHTPVLAVGINFDFTEEEPSAALRTLLRSSDMAKLAEADFVVERTELRRRLKRGNDAVLNLSVAEGDGSPTSIHVNFHKDVDGAASAATFLVGRVRGFRELALRFLSETYGLELEVGNQ